MKKPLQIKVLCGFKCNQKCIYCDNPKTEDADFTEFESVKYLINKIQDDYDIIIEADGGDAMEYEDLVSQLLSLNFPIYIFTNGTKLNKEFIMSLHSKAIMRISLDGIKQVHSQQRILKQGEDSFERTINGIELLNEYKIPFIIGTTITNLLIPYLNESKDFILSLKPQRWILTTQMFLNDPKRILTKDIHDKAKPIIEKWNNPNISFHSFHFDIEKDRNSRIEILFKANKIQVNITGFDTPVLKEYSYGQLDSLINDLKEGYYV